MICAGVETLLTTLPKSRLLADTLILAWGKALAVPVKPICELPPVALWVMLRVPVRVPAEFGWKLIARLQLAPAANELLLLQLPPLSLNSPEESEMAESCKAAVPVLVSVVFNALLLCPTMVASKLRLAGARVTAGVAVTVGLPKNAAISANSAVLNLFLSAPMPPRFWAIALAMRVGLLAPASTLLTLSLGVAV